MIKVTVWNEFFHERSEEAIRAVYPNGIHECIAGFLREDPELSVRTAHLDMPECGLTKEVLDDTDVLIWWGHCKHDRVPDEIAERVRDYVQRGMGLIPLHSAHASKPFRLLMGTPCTIKWRDGDFERVWTIALNHPIARGIGEYFELECEEMYGEPFAIPQPDELVFMGWFAGGEVLRSGCCWTRGLGRIFYFQPGHEANPTYYNENVRTIIRNAVHWACPSVRVADFDCPHVQPMKNHA